MLFGYRVASNGAHLEPDQAEQGGTFREVRTGAAPRKDPSPRIRPLCGRDPEAERTGQARGFDFLGFTHVCGKTRKGRFAVLRRTSRKRLRRKLGEVKTELRRRLHVPVPEVGKWLGTVLRGHFNYYGVPQNSAALNTYLSSASRTPIPVCDSASST